MNTHLQARGTVALLCILCLAAAAGAATGTIQITVVPGGGTVCIDTTCKEAAGPSGEPVTVTFDGMETGQYHMVNVYGTPGYEAYLGQVFLDPSGSSLAREIALEALPVEETPTASVKLYITPDGGKACLDRMCELSSGDGTGSWSVDFTEVTANRYHTITISHDGYESYTKEIYPVPGKTMSMSVTLKQIPPGSTPTATPSPLSTASPAPTPAAGLPLWTVLAALATCGCLWVLKGRKT